MTVWVWQKLRVTSVQDINISVPFNQISGEGMFPPSLSNNLAHMKSAIKNRAKHLVGPLTSNWRLLNGHIELVDVQNWLRMDIQWT